MADPASPMRSYRLRTYLDALDKLPAAIRRLAERKWEVFQRDPQHPSLRRHPLRGERHERLGRDEIYIDIRHRAVFRRGRLPQDDAAVFVWEWIGTKGSFVSRYDR